MHGRVLRPSTLNRLFLVFFGHLHHIEVRRVYPHIQPTDTISSQDICDNFREQDTRGVPWNSGPSEINYSARDIFS